ncbi:hypothetical protein MCP1_410014 [Candidatus Terasakiella magnetica]|nr:hypothetical protein MCP1_410014 [Candidatus Terasakiella magnetica]
MGSRDLCRCLEQRVERVQNLIGHNALFQAGMMVKGSCRCAALHSCDNWHDCAASHDALWQQVVGLITHPE